MGLPRFRIRTLIIAVGAIGITGGLAGLAFGLAVPTVAIGLYALDGPDPPETFDPVAWATLKGLAWGAAVGAMGWAATCLIIYARSWRPRMTTRRWMIAVAVVAASLAGFSFWTRHTEYRRRAERFADLERMGQSLLENHRRYIHGHHGETTDVRVAYARCRALRLKYEHAARRPWLPVPPDPPLPE